MKTILKQRNLTHAQHVRQARRLARSYHKGHPARRNLMEEARDHAKRREARSVHLAQSFLNGREYIEVEKDSRTIPDWDRVTELVTKYGQYYYKDRNISAEQDLHDRFVPNEDVEYARIVKRSTQKKVRIRPSNNKPN